MTLDTKAMSAWIDQYCNERKNTLEEKFSKLDAQITELKEYMRTASVVENAKIKPGYDLYVKEKKELSEKLFYVRNGGLASELWKSPHVREKFDLYIGA